MLRKVRVCMPLRHTRTHTHVHHKHPSPTRKRDVCMCIYCAIKLVQTKNLARDHRGWDGERQQGEASAHHPSPATTTPQTPPPSSHPPGKVGGRGREADRERGREGEKVTGRGEGRGRRRHGVRKGGERKRILMYVQISIHPSHTHPPPHTHI